ncbi:replication restart helicase PriA [Polynucleobacter paneuropaeus]|uniref:replication restart helicase PriA n=1 Tax=Polynucleobacter paneuropaeus TaxID=2527775 RepID=UPI001BFE0535|nr:primosomal protein N' [Polynucleobacter paneuropaeus]MBT8621589.1 primosomal protein N' [Polynucleobacter paneuropaeus]
MKASPLFVQIVLDKPLAQGFDYIWDSQKLGADPVIGQIVSVPFGNSINIGVIVKVNTHSGIEQSKLKAVLGLAPLPPLDSALLSLMNFASQYYIHSLGETIIPSIPQMWRKPERWEKLRLAKPSTDKKSKQNDLASDSEQLIGVAQLNPEQKNALDILLQKKGSGGFRAILLQGQTGSGKTAVFLNWLASVLQEKNSQVLLLVPEINLTPQLERRIRAYFPDKKIALLHSGVSEKQRGISWHEAMIGDAQIILGTRLAVLTPMPNLRAIVVDEEHDPSYKQQEGTRYSARDLAIWRAHDQGLPILLASATPSLETWMAAKVGRYEHIRLDSRAQGASLPKVHLVNTQDPQNRSSHSPLFTKIVEGAITKCLSEKKQSLILINRRGYAPVISCSACSWMSKCAQCSSCMVMHKAGALSKKTVLSCHHCGLVKPMPNFCPDCGNADLKPVGQGTQKIEDVIEGAWPQATVLRVDTDSSRRSKGAEELFQKIHEGDVDIVVGTQMIAKGHDYQNIGTVAVLDADSRLYSQDFRSAERLFAQLIQVAGRAGRSKQHDQASGDIYIETQHPDAAVFQYLLRHDVDGFLSFTAKEREESGLPPFSYQGLIHAEGKSIAKAIQFLSDLKSQLTERGLVHKGVKIYDPVPKTIMRVAGSERAQLLIESNSRKHLQELLESIDHLLRQDSQGRISKASRIRWLIERDPIAI